MKATFAGLSRGCLKWSSLSASEKISEASESFNRNLSGLSSPGASRYSTAPLCSTVISTYAGLLPGDEVEETRRRPPPASRGTARRSDQADLQGVPVQPSWLGQPRRA